MTVASGWLCEDWRRVEASALEPLYRAECGRWLEDLSWDFAPSCRIVETARRAGEVPGLVARGADGRVAAWTFFAVHDGVLQIGALAGEAEPARAALLRATLESPLAASARAVSCYLYPQSPELQPALEDAGFLAERHLYRGLALASAPAGSWTPAPGLARRDDPGRDVAGIAALLRHAYGNTREAACFAPDDRLEQWEHYVSGLLVTEGCGRYLPRASLAVHDADGHLAGVTLVTQIADDTAHLAQVAIDARWRGGGLGKGLVQESCRLAREAGFARMTLLVAEGNLAARDLYARLGFGGRRAFLHAVRDQASSGTTRHTVPA